MNIAREILEKHLNKDLDIKTYLKGSALTYEVVLDAMEEAINYIPCCTELKGKENLSFRDWKNLNKYTRAMHGYYKQGDKLVKSMDVILMYKDYQDTL